MTDPTATATAAPPAPSGGTEAGAGEGAGTGGAASVHPLLSGLTTALGPSLTAAITTSPILLIGAGGIGCELLKNLALSGFTRVTVVDLDTIDVSNLNRQFLFRSSHVGQAKCAVAAEVGRAMAPGGSAEYRPLHGNVCDTATFNVQYIGQFALVLNALDNVTARRRVNRLW